MKKLMRMGSGANFPDRVEHPHTGSGNRGTTSASKSYVDMVADNAPMPSHIKGGVDASATNNFPHVAGGDDNWVMWLSEEPDPGLTRMTNNTNAGDTWYVSAPGSLQEVALEAGDIIIARVYSASTSDSGDWVIINNQAHAGGGMESWKFGVLNTDYSIGNNDRVRFILSEGLSIQTSQPDTDTVAFNYALNFATENTRGAVKLGYTGVGDKIPLRIDAGQAYVDLNDAAGATTTSSTTPTVSLATNHSVRLTATGNLDITVSGGTAGKTRTANVIIDSHNSDRTATWTAGIYWQDDIKLLSLVAGWTYFVTITSHGTTYYASFTRMKS